MKKKNDYMKYWRVIRYFVKAKYELTQCDLDVILFLYSEGYFSKDKFNEFNEILSWDVRRFERLKQKNWIQVFRKRYGKRKALYELSPKSIQLCELIYKKLNGEELPESKSQNPMFLADVSFNDTVYRNMIKKMNEYVRQQRRLVPE
jgi:hypothetical protein